MIDSSPSLVRPVRGFGRVGWTCLAILAALATAAWFGFDPYLLGLHGIAHLFGMNAPTVVVGYWWVWVKLGTIAPQLSLASVCVLLPALWARPGRFPWGRLLVLVVAALVLPASLRWLRELAPSLHRTLSIPAVTATGAISIPVGAMMARTLLDAAVIVFATRSAMAALAGLLLTCSVLALNIVAARVYGLDTFGWMPPGWLLAALWNAAVGALAFHAAWLARYAVYTAQGLRCVECGYDTGQRFPTRCPECGAVPDAGRCDPQGATRGKGPADIREPLPHDTA